MVEIRGKIKDYKQAKDLVRSHGADYNGHYEFTDVIYAPVDGADQLSEEFVLLRIYAVNNRPGENFQVCRKTTFWSEGVQTREVECKKGFDSLDLTEKYIQTMFQEWKELIKYSRRGEEYHLGNTTVFLEEIEEIGPTVEIEGPEDGLVEELGLEVFSKSVPQLFFEASKANLRL